MIPVGQQYITNALNDVAAEINQHMIDQSKFNREVLFPAAINVKMRIAYFGAGDYKLVGYSANAADPSTDTSHTVSDGSDSGSSSSVNGGGSESTTEYNYDEI